VKLAKLRTLLEMRLQAQRTKVSVMRHLTQLRYHIDVAAQWTYGANQIGALSERTIEQVKQLTATSRVLAPAVYIFSRRVENMIMQKERELKKSLISVPPACTISPRPLTSRGPSSTSVVTATGASPTALVAGCPLSPDRKSCDFDSFSETTTMAGSSFIDDFFSLCGTQSTEHPTLDSPKLRSFSQTALSQQTVGLDDSELRSWFYYQCLSEKISRKNTIVGPGQTPLVSDLYSKVQKEKVPTQQWLQWMKLQLDVERQGLSGMAGPK